MLQEIDLFGLPVKTFGLFFALNFAAWGLLAARRLRELGKPVDLAFELVIVALLGGLVGARAYWLVQQGEAPGLGDIFGGSGLTWYGGLIGGTLAVLVWARRRDFRGLELLDFAGPGLALGYAIGRMPLALAAVILDVVAVLYVIHRQRKSSEAQLRGLELEDGTTPDFGPRILSFLETAVSYDHQSRAASLLGAIRQPGPDLLGHIFRLVERGALDETVRDLLSEQYLRLESNTRVAAKGAAA